MGNLVPKLMAELVTSLNFVDRTPVIVRAAMAHLNLVMIHPFSDGNGRMARCLQTLVLAREGILEPQFCSIEEYLGRNTSEYYAALAEAGKGLWEPGNDARPWLDFCLTAHHRQANTILRRIKETERLWNELEHAIELRGLPARTIFALADAATGYRIRNATYRSIAEVTDQVASRDLKLLVQSGFLVPDGEKRGRVYIGSPMLRSMRERVRESKPQPAPLFEAPYLPGFEPG